MKIIKPVSSVPGGPKAGQLFLYLPVCGGRSSPLGSTRVNAFLTCQYVVGVLRPWVAGGSTLSSNHCSAFYYLVSDIIQYGAIFSQSYFVKTQTHTDGQKTSCYLVYSSYSEQNHILPNINCTFYI